MSFCLECLLRDEGEHKPTYYVEVVLGATIHSAHIHACMCRQHVQAFVKDVKKNGGALRAIPLKNLTPFQVAVLDRNSSIRLDWKKATIQAGDAELFNPQTLEEAA